VLQHLQVQPFRFGQAPGAMVGDGLLQYGARRR
jgi:hypothetical protein